VLSEALKKRLRGGAQSEAAAPVSSAPLSRRSNGLRETLTHLSGQKGLRILDLGPAAQANINFITGLGHKIFNEDLYAELAAFRSPPSAAWNVSGFLEQNLDYQEGLFDGVFCWDALDWLPDPAAAAEVVFRLAMITKPGGAVLVFFHTADPGAALPVCRTQIAGPDSLQLFPRGKFTLQRPLNNRNIERLFRQFHALKFFLTQDNLREVLAVR
jgi:hypothetical protein